jgi:hypothetical protein
MKTAFLAALIAASMVGAAAATLAINLAGADASPLAALGGQDHGDHADGEHGDAGADEHSLHGTSSDELHGAHDQVGMKRPRFPAAEGSVPSAEDAKRLEEVPSLRVLEDKGFNPKNGVRDGKGTLSDPFVISGYYVTGDLYLGDTDACFEVVGNYISGQLTLNWNGQCVWVHHNFIRDLRVNENVDRTGYATGGLIEANQIEFIGQLRHYDGEVRNNVVGPRTSASAFDTVLEETPLLAPDLLLANVDGFNQGLIHHNTFYGPVDLDLHGHHHGTGFFAPHSHYHADDSGHMPDHAEDHTDRWTSVAFTDNRIVDELSYGLRYEDQNHAGDDRTATSEDNEMLDETHVHRTDIEIARNVVEGAQIWVDVFNADDENHEKRNDGWLRITDNQVTLKERKDEGLFGLQLLGDAGWPLHEAIHVEAAKEVETTITGNVLAFVALPAEQRSGPLGLPILLQEEIQPAAIRVEGVRDAALLIEGNRASGFYYGVAAAQMDEDTTWEVAGNLFDGARHPVYYDDSVENAPGGEQGAQAQSDDEEEPVAAGQRASLPAVGRLL